MIMSYRNCLLALICIAALWPVTGSAQDDRTLLESDWMELVKGYRENTVGAQLREIDDHDTDFRTVTLAIPKARIRHPDDIEEIVVVGRKPEKPEPLDITYEWLDDYDDDNYGLVIRLGKGSIWPIRLYMYSDPGFTR